MRNLYKGYREQIGGSYGNKIQGMGWIAYWTESANGFHAIFFKGKADKPVFHYRFKTQESMMNTINEYKDRIEKWNIRKQVERIERHAYKHTYKIGEIIVNSWGYDQTNIDFYQVVKTTDKTVHIRSISGKLVDSEIVGSMAGRTVAIKDQFKSDEILIKRVGIGDAVGFQCGSGFRWNGKAEYVSWYA